jgi:glycosyltransferase involved in cell wall biosynthesis
LADYYAKQQGWACDVIWDMVPDFSSPEILTPDYFEARRKLGLVTMINPMLAKGGMQFLQIANVCQSRMPDLRFLCIESRGTRKNISQHVKDLDKLSNIWWLPKQKNMKLIFDRTAILLVPSLWFEASARVIAEAQLCGIPVIANDVGGIGEQLNGGGMCFEPPPKLRADPRALSSQDDIEPWVNAIECLLGKSEAYSSACDAAVHAAQPFKVAERQAAVQAFFRKIAPPEV